MMRALTIPLAATLAIGLLYLAFTTFDPPTAAFICFAVVLVCAIGSLPVIFSVRTRRAERLRSQHPRSETTLSISHPDPPNPKTNDPGQSSRDRVNP